MNAVPRGRASAPLRRRLECAAVLSLALLGSLVPVTPVQAIHSLPQPYLWYWDTDNDGTPEGNPSVDAAGNGWTTLALARLDGAIAAWKNATSFKPVHVVTGNFKVYRDGTAPPCGGFEANDLQVTCVGHTLRHLPGAPPDEYYQDISSASTYAQRDANLPGSIVRFWYGAAQSSTPGDLDFQGILTHELGHWILLADLGPNGLSCNYGTGIHTMCGELTDPGYEDQSYRQRSLTTDDISAANIVY